MGVPGIMIMTVMIALLCAAVSASSGIEIQGCPRKDANGKYFPRATSKNDERIYEKGRYTLRGTVTMTKLGEWKVLWKLNCKRTTIYTHCYSGVCHDDGEEDIEASDLDSDYINGPWRDSYGQEKDITASDCSTRRRLMDAEAAF